MGKAKVNAIRPGTEIVRELTFKKVKELAGRDLSQAKYPLYMYMDEPRFQLASLDKLDSVNVLALKELSVRCARCPSALRLIRSICSKNRLSKLEDIDCFEKLKRLWAAENAIKRVSINFKFLDLLDLSGNGLFEIPDLSGCPALKELDLSKNKARGVWTGLVDCVKLEKLNLAKNKFKWDQEQFTATLEIQQLWTKIKEINLAGNRVHKFEGYRYYMSTYSKKLKMLDGVETSGDNDKANMPPNPLKVKTIAEVQKYYAMKKKLMANPELMEAARLAGEANAAAEAAAERAEAAANGEEPPVEEEKKEEAPPPELDKDEADHILVSELTSQLLRCFEGPRIAIAILQRINHQIDTLLQLPIDERVMFEKGIEPMEVVEDFLQNLVGVMEKDTSTADGCTRILIKMCRVVNFDVGKRCLMQLKDLLLSSAVMAELGGPILVEILIPVLNNPEMPQQELDQIVYIMNDIQHPDITKNLGVFIDTLITLMKERDDAIPPAPALLGMFVTAANECSGDPMLVAKFTKAPLA